MKIQNIKVNIPVSSIDWNISLQDSDNIICVIDKNDGDKGFLRLFEILFRLDIKYVSDYLLGNGSIQCIGQKYQEPFLISLKGVKEPKTDEIAGKKVIGKQCVAEETFLLSENLNNIFQNYKYSKSYREFLYPHNIFKYYRVFAIYDDSFNSIVEEIDREPLLNDSDWEILEKAADKYSQATDDIIKDDKRSNIKVLDWLNSLSFIKHLCESLGVDGNIPIVLCADCLHKDMRKILEDKTSLIFEALRKIGTQVFILLDTSNEIIERNCDKVIRL